LSELLAPNHPRLAKNRRRWTTRYVDAQFFCILLSFLCFFNPKIEHHKFGVRTTKFSIRSDPTTTLSNNVRRWTIILLLKIRCLRGVMSMGLNFKISWGPKLQGVKIKSKKVNGKKMSSKNKKMKIKKMKMITKILYYFMIMIASGSMSGYMVSYT